MILSSIFKNPVTYWLRWVVNKQTFLYKNKSKNIKIDYLSHITNSTMADNTTLYQNVRLHNSSIDCFSYVANGTTIIGVKIGKFCSIGPNCRIGLGMHPTQSFVSTHPVFFSTESHVQIKFVEKNIFNEFKKIIIGNDVWIGANVLIRDGVKIGDGVIVGAGAIVTKDVPDYAIIAGNPAKIIRYRFSMEEIKYLKTIQWWNKDIKTLRKDYKKYQDIKILMEVK
jgi:acetyltransferase-like isoleucine patch superfamily enzyme